MPHSQDEPGALVDAPAAAPPAPSRLRRWLTRPADPPQGGRPPVADDLPEPAEGLHALRRGPDVGFGIEAAQIERAALDLARAAAAANLPRADVEYDEVQEEAALHAECGAAFHGWAERVRTRVQDALQEHATEAAVGVGRLEREVAGIESAVSELREARGELAAVESESGPRPERLEIEPRFDRWKYVVLISLLVLVDWIANVPVFSELLPKDPGADAAWRAIAARAEGMGALGGLYRVGARALHNVDASILALGVIVFLVWMSHVVGDSLRRLRAHSESERPDAAHVIRAQRRQALPPLVIGAVGVVAVLGVLWLGRDLLESTTAARVAETETAIATLTAERETARGAADLEEVGRLEQNLSEQRVLLDQRRERAGYALVISRMNVPILLLNLVLALAAAVAAYLTARGLLQGSPRDARTVRLLDRIGDLEGRIARGTREVIDLEAAVTKRFRLAEYLRSVEPLSGWEAKVERLQAVVPSFRSENARVRGMDASKISAFRRPPVLRLQPVPDAPDPAPPEDLGEHAARFHDLRARAGRVAARRASG